MNATLFLDSLLTVLLAMALVGMGVATLWLLPWSDADRAGTVRALGALARQAAEVTGRPRGPRQAPPSLLPAR